MKATLGCTAVKVAPRPIAALLLAAAAGVCAPDARATLIRIDDFALPGPAQFFLVPPGSNSSLQMSQVVSGPIGGQRDLMFHVVGPTAVNSANALVGHDGSFSIDALQIATNGLAPTVVTVQYSGPNTSNTTSGLVNTHGLGGGAGLDLTDGGTNDRFQIQFLSSDAQPTSGLDVALTLTSPGGSSTTHATAQNSLSPFSLQIPFSQFVGTADWAHVDSITLAFNSVKQTPNIDFEIQGISAVPEPAGAITLAIGGALIGAYVLAQRLRPSWRLL